MAGSVDPDEKACYEPPHLSLHCLQRYMFWYAGFNELIHRKWIAYFDIDVLAIFSLTSIVLSMNKQVNIVLCQAACFRVQSRCLFSLGSIEKD